MKFVDELKQNLKCLFIRKHMLFFSC